MQIQLNHDTVVLYHKNCLDGIAAAWVAWQFFNREADLIAVQYGNKFEEMFGNNFENLIGKNVYCLDFSFDREVVKHLAGICNFILLDHHNTAARALEGLVCTDILNLPVTANDIPHQSLLVVDEKFSGAMLAWKFFYPNYEAPWGIRFVQDRDLWQWAYEDTRAWTSAAFSYEKTVENFNALIERDPSSVIAEGANLARVQANNVAIVAKSARRFVLDGYDVPIVNCNAFLASDIGALLGKGEPFVVLYVDGHKERQFSLRTSSKEILVNEIAERFGGGGHPEAAGFQIAFDDDRFGMSHVYVESEYYQRFAADLCKV